jgi:hypothetical protein
VFFHVSTFYAILRNIGYQQEEWRCFFIFGNLKKECMNKWLIPLLLVSAAVALYEQSLSHPNYYLMGTAGVLFVFCMTKLSAKIPPKKEEDGNE